MCLSFRGYHKETEYVCMCCLPVLIVKKKNL